MEYTVGTNWDFGLIEQIDYPEVKSVFGGIPNALISSGRSSFMINSIQEEDLKAYIARVHAKGWDFDYNINSNCIENMELTSAGHKKIMEYFENVVGLGVDSVTISIPNLILIAKKHFPQLKVKVSTYQKINSVAMAKHFEDLGADAVMLSEHVNRDFKLLRAIRESVDCKVVLIANTGCIYACPNMHSHTNSISHSGSKTAENTILTESYAADCLYRRLRDVTEIIKSRWIRPEDVVFYEEIGIDMLKIIDRHSSTEALAERMKAYHERSYEGNFLNMLGQMINRKKSADINMDSVFDLKKDEDLGKVRKFLGVFNISLPDLYYFDNKKIPADFLQEFAKRDCAKMSCAQCGYCKKVAETTIEPIDSKEKIRETLHKLEKIRGEIIDGTILY